MVSVWGGGVLTVTVEVERGGTALFSDRNGEKRKRSKLCTHSHLPSKVGLGLQLVLASHLASLTISTKLGYSRC